MRLFIFFICTMLLSSCGKFSDGTSIWAGQLWIAPLIPAVLAAIFGYLTYRQWKSGSRTYDAKGKVINDDAGKMPVYKLSWFVPTIITILVTVIVIIWINKDK